MRKHTRNWLLTPLLLLTAAAGTAAAQCPGDDVYEDNDTCATARPLTLGYTGNLQVHGAGADPDYFRFTLMPGWRGEVEIYFAHSINNLDLHMYDVTGGCPGSLIASSNSTANVEHVEYDNLTASPMQLVVHIEGIAPACNTYGMNLAFLNPICDQGDDVYEDNDTCLTAVPLPMGLVQNLVVYGEAYSTGKDDDYYTVTLQDNEQIDIDLDYDAAFGDLDIRVYDLATVTCPVHPQSGLIAGEQIFFGVSGPISIHHDNYSGVAQNLLIWIDNWDQGEDCNSYSLNSVITPSQCTAQDAYEPNDDCFTAPTVQGGLTTGLIGRKYETDFFRVEVPAGATLDASIFFQDSIGNLDLYLWDLPPQVCGGTGGGYVTAGRTITDDESISWTNGTSGVVPMILEARYFGQGSSYCVDYELEVLFNGVAPPARFCFGDGSDGVSCPCGNVPVAGFDEGCVNVSGLGALLSSGGIPSVSADSLVLTVDQAAPSDFGIFVQNITTQTPVPFYNGAFCLAGDSHLVRHYAPPAIQPTITDPAGSGVNAQAMTLGDFIGDTAPGVTVHYQFWGRDNGGPCGAGANFSSGLSVTWQP